METVGAGPAVVVEGLTARYGEHVVLDALSLEVGAGEIAVIMGGSGSGKSTLLRHLIGLERPVAGRVLLLGQDLATLSGRALRALRKHMGVAFQGGALFSSMSVIENIRLPLEELTDLDPRTIEIMARLKLEVVGLAGSEHLMPDQLSGGMLKRAAVARALVMDPKLLFFDEPSAGLDPVVAAELDELILRLREALGMTIVVVTHERDSAFRIADRLLVLDAGRIIAAGGVAELRASVDPRVRDLLARRVEQVQIDADSYLRRLTDTHAR